MQAFRRYMTQAGVAVIKNIQERFWDVFVLLLVVHLLENLRYLLGKVMHINRELGFAHLKKNWELMKLHQ